MDKKALGIDAGSQTTKAVLMGSDGIMASCVIQSGDESDASARAAAEQILEEAGLKLDDNLFIVSTGMGGGV